jgi:hypothetical protein
VTDLNRERVRHADRFIFTSREDAAGSAMKVYRELQARGEAHAKPISLFLIEGEGPPRPL